MTKRLISDMTYGRRNLHSPQIIGSTKFTYFINNNKTWNNNKLNSLSPKNIIGKIINLLIPVKFRRKSSENLNLNRKFQLKQPLGQEFSPF